MAGIDSIDRSGGATGEFRSPGGFVFGVQGWNWGEQKVTGVTFNVDGTARVFDQHGRPIKGALVDGKPVFFDDCNHQEIIETLYMEGVDVIESMNMEGTPCPGCKGKGKIGGRACQQCFHVPTGRGTGRVPTLSVSGWPQLSYEKLKRIKNVPPTPMDVLEKIADDKLREAAIKYREENPVPELVPGFG